jgi:hypothetical protein
MTTVRGVDLSARLSGWNICLQPSLQFVGDLEPRKRSWEERLFELPWRPWEAYDMVRYWKPDLKLYILDNSTLVCHPQAYEILQCYLKSLESK